MDDRDRRAPVTLPADAPVAQPPGDLHRPEPLLLERVRDRLDRLLEAHAAEVVGVDGDAALLVGVPVLPPVIVEVRLVVDQHHLDDLYAVLVGEGEVPLVVRRHPHHGAIAVAHQHIVADPQRHRLVGDRVRHRQARGDALLLLCRQLGLGGAAGLALLQEGRHGGIVPCRLQRQRVLGRDGAEGHAHDGVGARREDVHASAADQFAGGVVADVVREGEAHALALADPVLLHQTHPLGPAGQPVLGVFEQFPGVLRDLQVVAGNLALLDRGAGAPALAVDHLLVGQHGLVDRIPVDHLRLAVGDALFQHPQEQPLVPFVVGRVAGRDLAAPVDRQPHRLKLLLHVGDVVVGPLGRRHAILDGGVLGRQAEGVPAHRHQHVVPVHAQVAREHVVDGVVAHVPHVQPPARVRQHGAGVVLLAAGVLGHAVRVGGAPVRLGGRLDLAGLVAGVHWHALARQGRPGRAIIAGGGGRRAPIARSPKLPPVVTSTRRRGKLPCLPCLTLTAAPGRRTRRWRIQRPDTPQTRVRRERRRAAAPRN